MSIFRNVKKYVPYKLLQNKHFKFGVPFLIGVVGGSFGLQYYSQLRYDIQKERKIITKTKEIQALIKTKPRTIEEEYEEYQKTVDLDNWQNIRGPRPWEEGGEVNQGYKELIEKRAQESKNQWIFKK